MNILSYAVLFPQPLREGEVALSKISIAVSWIFFLYTISIDRLYLFCLNLSKADENSLKGGSSSFTFCFFNVFSYSFFFSLSTLAFSWSWIKKAKQVRVKHFNIFNKPDQLIQIYQREVLLSCFKKYMISKRYNNMPLTTKWELIRRIFIGHWKSWHFGKIRNTKIAVLKLKGRGRLLRSSLSILSNLRFSKSFFLPLPNTYMSNLLYMLWKEDLCNIWHFF